ncbi:MAG: hypothetical protein IJ444_04640 [Kiritimatiellae bacterium]|nr:hypothetical protein [Kiritimatiellia bacterium]
MKFIKLGKSYQLCIDTPAALKEVIGLDESLWAISSAPTSAYLIDKAFLGYIDTDANGRIRTDEIKNVVQWCLDTVTDISCFGEPKAELETSLVNDASVDGPGLKVTIAYVAEQYKTDGKVTSLDNVRLCMKEIRGKPLNGDGVVVPESSVDAEISAYISAAIKATGGTPDISGATGVNLTQLESFRDAIKAFLEWKKNGAEDSPAMPLGAATPKAWDTMKKYEEQLDKFFLVARFRDFDPTNSARFISASSAADTAGDALCAAPIAKPDDNGALPLVGAGINPIHRALINDLKNAVIKPILGEGLNALTEADWNKIKSTLAPYGEYLASKKGAIVEGMAQADLEKWTDEKYHKAIVELTVIDQDIANRAAALNKLEKLILCRIHLIEFLNNYVNLSKLYNPKENALFECGRAVIDGRWFNMAIPVTDTNAHSNVAKGSGIFIIYLDVIPNDKTPTLKVAMPATSGTRGNLAVGKRGVFFDLKGNEHDAVITKIIEAPISLHEAMLAPFKKVGEFLIGKIEGKSANAEKALISTVDATTKNPPANNQNGNSPANMMMGLSLSVAALGSSLAFITKSLGNMDIWTILQGLGIAFLAVLVPIVLVAFIKLGRQDLSSILEGCGWAVNQRMRLTKKLRKQFTAKAKYPCKASGTPCKRFFSNLFYTALAILDIYCLYWFIKVIILGK